MCQGSRVGWGLYLSSQQLQPETIYLIPSSPDPFLSGDSDPVDTHVSRRGFQGFGNLMGFAFIFCVVVVEYYWREVPQVSFLSRQTCVCRDKKGFCRHKSICRDKSIVRQNYVCRDKIFLSRQTRVCHGKCFVATKSILLSRQTTCFVATNTAKVLSRQAYFCFDKRRVFPDKNIFVETKRLSRPN